MRCVDASILIAAGATNHPHHAQATRVLQPTGEALGLPSVALSAFLRITTNRRALKDPATPGQSLAFVDALLTHPDARVVNAGPRHWEIFRGLMGRYEARADDIPDLYLAAIAIENAATWVSFDRGFARFRELTWVNPLDA